MSEFSLKAGQTVVVKVGSSLVTGGGQGVDRAQLALWASEIAALRGMGLFVAWVSSGAVAEGIKRLGWKTRPNVLSQLQAAAAVGQMGLVQAYEAAFSPLGIQAAQILLTHEDLSHRARYLNARGTIKTLLQQGVVPVINENDTVTTDEIKLGDNDTLSALVVNLIDADALVILTDQKGVYDSDPRHNSSAQLIRCIAACDKRLDAMAGGAGSVIGTGGMQTKIMAARRAALSGATTLIASGQQQGVLLDLMKARVRGTLLTPDESRQSARRRWLLGQVRVSGRLTVDAGAAKALLSQHSSLLAIGCVAVEGSFVRGATVAIVNEKGDELARGLVNYSSAEIHQLLGKPSSDIIATLGYMAEEELIHRDNMAPVAASSNV